MAANKLSFAMISDKGRVRRANEDACVAAPSSGIFAVCDGMGGAAGGEVASHLAVETFLTHLSLNGPPMRVQSRINAAIQAANHAILEQARKTPELSGMGTTLVALLHAPIIARDEEPGPKKSARHHPNARATDPPTLWLVHVGDSRCYQLRRTHLKLLTRDHSLVEEQVRAGQITPEQAAESPMRNLITRAVGAQGAVEPEIHGYRPLIGDLYLLASDGLTRDLSDDDLEEILRAVPAKPEKHDLYAACKALVDAANERGGGDNITVLLVSVQPS
ncbi:MAG: protein phosphatase 2C domain-containing protein [Edaphobacter sp.]|uniref:PP2C family protein-serine/threonine phosphatase n=1 Tax=Edaphobacter sp. TaxID=1934404 RepID=UPI002385AD3F|nr:PP2C family serine/threonine-protein phosphatase [Edaphobacter sp.]MDE1177854.1 protein phosphatase 2C domain-containing protein [Edaphobacter sp.]